MGCGHCAQSFDFSGVRAYWRSVLDSDGDAFGLVLVVDGRVVHACEWVPAADVNRIQVEATMQGVS